MATESKKLIDIGLFKAGLEFARFTHPEVRELMVEAINALDLDLDDAGYEPSVDTIAIFEKFEKGLEEADDDDSTDKTVVAGDGNDDDEDDPETYTEEVEELDAEDEED